MSVKETWRRIDRFFSFHVSPAVKWIIYVNTAVLLLYYIIFALIRLPSHPLVLADPRFLIPYQEPTLSDYIRYFCGVVPQYVLTRGFVWQLITYMFLHAGGFHLFFNMLVVWFFGPRLERYWGTRKFLFFYFLVGAGAALFYVGVLWISRRMWAVEGVIPLIGASGAIFGILLAYALYWPDDIVYVMAIFPMKIKWLVLIFAGFTFLASIGPQQSPISHLTHLGGLIVAFVYLRGWRLIKSQRRDKSNDTDYHSRRSRSIFDDDNDNWWKGK